MGDEAAWVGVPGVGELVVMVTWSSVDDGDDDDGCVQQSASVATLSSSLPLMVVPAGKQHRVNTGHQQVRHVSCFLCLTLFYTRFLYTVPF